MRKMLLVAVSVMIILIVSGCGASENNDTIENTVVTDKADVYYVDIFIFGAICRGILC